MNATVTVDRVIHETHTIEFDQDDYLTWLEGETPNEDNLIAFFKSERDWECRFTDDTMTGAEPWDADIDTAVPEFPFPTSMDARTEES